jgi:tetratricopeptide (TPR) repeat protein/transcriptional regulator with XRE-family HTH domain
MKTFGELLSQHMRRAGISDAEMARTLGVQRQTIFRWREGLVQHPRERADILRIASKLRLTPVERDELLLAAGFAPQEEMPALAAQAIGPADEENFVALPAERAGSVEQTAPQLAPLAAAEPSQLPPRKPRLWLAVGVVAVLALLVLAAAWFNRPDEPPVDGARSGPGIDLPSPAQPGETLILLSQFANYSQGQAGYNIAGRLQDALNQEMATAGLQGIRIEQWPEVIDSPEAALAATQATSATLVLWGEYDSGRVVARVQAPQAARSVDQQELRRLVETPADLNVTVNTDLPEEMRWMALYVLGEAELSAGRHDTAAAALQRALAIARGNDEATSRIYYDLGFIESARPDADLSQAIAQYTLAIERRPDFASALNNRGVSYFNRRAQGDLQRAVQDFERAVSLDPDFASGQFNLGLALLALGSDEQERALAALRRAQTLAPDAPGPNNALCWEYALQAKPEEALPYCDRAVALDPTPFSRDSRGVVYALLGRNEAAIAEFQSFVTWLQGQAESVYNRYAPKRLAWIEALRQDTNPFDQATLDALRSE